ncbi:MAG: tetratricopeptide repeat protein [Aestuariibaculum sp.]
MKKILLLLLTLAAHIGFAQDNDEHKLALLAEKKAEGFVFEGNTFAVEDDFIEAEMAYRKALSEQSNSVAGAYNLGNAYIKKGNTDEALYRLKEAIKSATTKAEKHKAFHNMGNVLMQNKKCKEAVEAYKNALRNNPMDEETRYNLALAKECAEQQKDNQNQNNDQNQDNQDKNQDKNQDQQDKDNQDNQDKKEGDDKQDENQDKQDEGDKKDEGQDKKDEEGKPKDNKKDQGNNGNKEKEQPQQPKPKQGQLSPQQIKNLLEAMNNQEQKVQEKINAEKVKGVKEKTDKDW